MPFHHYIRQLEFCLVLSSVKRVLHLIIFILLLLHTASPHILLPRQCLPQRQCINCHQQAERIKGGLYNFAFSSKAALAQGIFCPSSFIIRQNGTVMQKSHHRPSAGRFFQRSIHGTRMCLLSIHRSIDPTLAPFIAHRSYRQRPELQLNRQRPLEETRGVMTDSDSILLHSAT